MEVEVKVGEEVEVDVYLDVEEEVEIVAVQRCTCSWR